MDNLKDIAKVFEAYKETNEKLYLEVNECSKEEIELEKQIGELEHEILQMSA